MAWIFFYPLGRALSRHPHWFERASPPARRHGASSAAFHQMPMPPSLLHEQRPLPLRGAPPSRNRRHRNTGSCPGLSLVTSFSRSGSSPQARAPLSALRPAQGRARHPGRFLHAASWPTSQRKRPPSRHPPPPDHRSLDGQATFGTCRGCCGSAAEALPVCLSWAGRCFFLVESRQRPMPPKATRATACL